MGAKTGVTRRRLLTAASSVAIGKDIVNHDFTRDQGRSYRLVLNSPSSVRVHYEFVVTGDVRKTTNTNGLFSEDVVTTDPEERIIDAGGRTVVRGITQGGVDAFVYTGQIVGFDSTNCSDFNVWVDGSKQSACALNRNYNESVAVEGGDDQTSSASNCLLEHFRDYSIDEPATYRSMQNQFAESAKEAEVIRQWSNLNINAIHALETIAELHYHDWVGATKEFLELLYDNTNTLQRENDPEYFDSVNKYSRYANSVYRLVNRPTESVTGYVDTVQEAVNLRQERDLDSMLAAMRLASKGRNRLIRDNAIGLAVEIGELPLDDAVTGLKVNAQEALVLKVCAESQLPILRELENLARKRNRETITEKEMYVHFIYSQEYWSAIARFNNQIRNLEELGREESILFNLGRQINEILGNDVLEASEEGIENAKSMYEVKTRQLAYFREEAQRCSNG